MVADLPPQVWLETVPGTTPARVVAYVKADHEARLSYRMDVVQVGRSGQSRIRQSGTVQAAADTPTQLGMVSVDAQPGDDCQVAIAVQEAGAERGLFRFACPR